MRPTRLLLAPVLAGALVLPALASSDVHLEPRTVGAASAASDARPPDRQGPPRGRPDEPGRPPHAGRPDPRDPGAPQDPTDPQDPSDPGDGGGPDEPVEPRPLPDLDDIDPVRFDRDAAVVEHVQVTTRGGVDRMWVDIVRPDTDEPVPTILISSPYYNTLGRGWRGELKSPHQGPSNPLGAVNRSLGGGSAEAPFPEWYDEHFVERGYAVALMDLRGSRNSSGCFLYGDRAEVRDTVDVIDHLAEQPWSNGRVGMTGGSYDGTLAIGAAVEQPISGRNPDALAAIIPLRAISRWYDYHFFDGAQSQGHALTPSLFNAVLPATDTQNAGTDDVLLPLHLAARKACIPTFGALVSAGYASPYQDATSPFWRQRDYVADADRVRAATFLVAGLFDYNVKNHNSANLWEALPDDVPSKLWWFNGTHADPHTPTSADAGSNALPHPFQDRFVEATHRWFAQFLKGLDAGALDTPAVETQRADGTWAADDAWPVAHEDLVLGVAADGTLRPGEHDGTITFRDGPVGDHPTSALLVTEPFATARRLSGRIVIDLDATLSGPDATVAVDVRLVPPGVDPGASGSLVHDGSETRAVQATYAWIRAAYRDSVTARGTSSPTEPEPVVPGETVTLRFGALPTDLVVPEGWRLSFRFSPAAGGTLAAGTGGDVTLRSAPGRGIHLPLTEVEG